MKYNPTKEKAIDLIKKHSFFRIFFYKFLDLILLRAWHINKELKNWRKGKETKSMHILDAGAGFGQYSYAIGHNNPKWNILSIDSKEEHVCNCNSFFRKRKLQNIFYRKGELSQYVSKHTFDLILSVDVLEKIKEDDKTLKNFYQSLKKNGMLLFCVSSKNNGQPNPCQENIHQGYSIPEIKEKLQSAGFSKIEATYSYGTIGKLSWYLSIKFPIMLIDSSKYLIALLPFYYLLVGPFCYIFNLYDLHANLKKGAGIVIKAWK